MCLYTPFECVALGCSAPSVYVYELPCDAQLGSGVLEPFCNLSFQMYPNC